MDRIGEVKKILKHYFSDTPGGDIGGDIAQEICQLFEIKPDQSRLLTDEEYNKATKDAEQEWMWNRRGVNRGRARAEIAARLEAQDAKTAPIKDAECKAEIDKLTEEANEIFNEAIELIKTWHNMGMADFGETAWALYGASPEMAHLNQSIKSLKAKYTSNKEGTDGR